MLNICVKSVPGLRFLKPVNPNGSGHLHGRPFAAAKPRRRAVRQRGAVVHPLSIMGFALSATQTAITADNERANWLDRRCRKLQLRR
jgi:hypothetical protein